MDTSNTPNKLNIINVSPMDPDWNWLAKDIKAPQLSWSHYSSQSTHVAKILPKKESFARLINAKNAVLFSKQQPSILVSHGPRPTMYTALSAKLFAANSPHLAYSFNFTNLPTGMQHKVMAKAFQQPDKLVVFSSMEKQLYADYFDIDPNKIDMLHWGVHAAVIDNTSIPIESGDYICAVGSQGRDYQVLIAAMQKLKHIKLVLVTTADSIKGLSIPDNVKVHTNIPLQHAHNIILHSKFMVLPLRDSQVPCGHVTIVSGMFFRKAMLVTNSKGVHDYIQDNVTGRFFKPHDPDGLSADIEALWNSPNQIESLANAALNFANTHCTEQTVVKYFQHFIDRYSETK